MKHLEEAKSSLIPSQPETFLNEIWSYYSYSKNDLKMSGGNRQHDESPDGNIAVEENTITQKPKQYAVLLLNDDYTPMDFVVLVLKRFFGRNQTEAEQIMLDVHKKGSGVAGIYSYEVAEMKVMQVNQFSQLNQYPLKSTLEAMPEED